MHVSIWRIQIGLLKPWLVKSKDYVKMISYQFLSVHDKCEEIEGGFNLINNPFWYETVTEDPLVALQRTRL